MYREILIHPEQRDCKQIIWRFSEQDPIPSYRLDTLTNGVNYPLLIVLFRTLQQLLLDQEETFTIAKYALQAEICVDDTC